jgi:hypothetical protein
MTQRYRCTLCDEEFGEVPEDAILVGRQRNGNITFLRPADVRVHNLKLVKIKESENEPTQTSD